MLKRTIWWEILKETTQHTSRDLGLSWAWRHPMIPVLLFAIFTVLVWTNISADEASLQIQERVLWLAAPLMVFPPWWIIRLFTTIPEREQRSEKRIVHLRKRLTPRFQIEVLNGGGPAFLCSACPRRTGLGDMISAVSELMSRESRTASTTSKGPAIWLSGYVDSVRS